MRGVGGWEEGKEGGRKDKGRRAVPFLRKYCQGSKLIFQKIEGCMDWSLKHKSENWQSSEGGNHLQGETICRGKTIFRGGNTTFNPLKNRGEEGRSKGKGRERGREGGREKGREKRKEE